jgi:hypothetical protein
MRRFSRAQAGRTALWSTWFTFLFATECSVFPSVSCSLLILGKLIENTRDSHKVPTQAAEMQIRRSVPIENHFQMSVLQVTCTHGNHAFPKQRQLVEPQPNDRIRNTNESSNHKCLQEMSHESESSDCPVKRRRSSRGAVHNAELQRIDHGGFRMSMAFLNPGF